MRQRLCALMIGTLLLTGCGSDGEDEPLAGPDVPEPTTAEPSSTSTSQPPKAGPVVPATLPANSVLAPVDLGPGWTTTAADPAPCAPSLTPEGTRSVGLTRGDGVLTETIYSDLEVVPAVRAWRASLERCGYAVEQLRLGDDGLTARPPDRGRTVLVTGTEGVLVVLHLTGAIARATDEIESWADIAMGTSCEAAHDGCH